MAWFASHQEFENDPRTLDLMSEMNWDLDVCIGKWHRLVWWCIDYAEDGILAKHKLSRIALAIGLRPEDGERFKYALIASGYATDNPDFRIAGWWGILGRFLQIKYKKRKKEWEKIRKIYADCLDDEANVDEPALMTVPGEVTVTPNNTLHETRKDKNIETNKTIEHNTISSASHLKDARGGGPVQLDILLPEFEKQISNEEFSSWYRNVNQMIEKENSARQCNRFVWNTDANKIEKEMRILVYQWDKSKKTEILTKVFELTGKKIHWLEYIMAVITITVRQSKVSPLRNPTGFAIELIQQPQKVVSNPTTGVSI